MKQSLFAIVIIALLFTGIVIVSRSNSTPPAITDSAALDTFTDIASRAGITDLSITPNTEVGGIYTITGKAQGYMFEGSFPVTVTTPDSRVVYEGHTETTSGWMTTDPVPFQFSINFIDLPRGPLSLWLRADDPSGGESGRPTRQLEIPIINTNHTQE